MRITIIQTEIEEAIRNHILQQISVQEGMEIDITLRATRGSEGYQADIDIHPKRPEAATPKKASKPLNIEETVTAAKSGRGRKAAESKSEPKQEPVAANEAAAEEAPVAEAETPAETSVEAEADTQSTATATATAEPEVETAKVASIFASKANTDQEEAPPAEGRKSLFGDLKKPVNA